MENIVEEIKKINSEERNNSLLFKNYTEFKEYIEDVKSRNLLIPETYSLPQIDTIGKRLFQNQSKVGK